MSDIVFFSSVFTILLLAENYLFENLSTVVFFYVKVGLFWSCSSGRQSRSTILRLDHLLEEWIDRPKLDSRSGNK